MENQMSYNMDKQTIIVTGANSGIGKAATIQLASLGANVIMACRSAERGASALNDVRKAAKSDNIELLQLDLSSQASIRGFVKEFKKRHDRLDVLIHNAANFDQSMKKPVLTEDGVETIFATNHIGPFLMTNLLTGLLQKSAPSRIITVASKGLQVYPFLDIEFSNLNGEKKYTPQHAYYQSKLAQLMFTYDLAEKLKGTGVTVNCVRVTNVALPDERITDLPKWMQNVYRLKRRMSISPEQQARTYVYLAADPSVREISGGYFDENNRQVLSNKNSYNRETWKKLWNVSEKLSAI
jgi:NAD(P)-dependent dehydrogenase (short-subunit alcohol dehydrogenase family)